jgi:CRP-like cAMP-binding protein
MYIEQKHIFWRMSKACVKKILNISRKETFPKGHTLFTRGDPANFFYSLIKGRIRISIGQGIPTVYIVSHGGEAFGWSSLIGRDQYTATAETVEQSTLLVFDKDQLLEILALNPEDGLVLFRQLAALLSKRLIQSYEIIGVSFKEEGFTSYGSGQMQGPQD